MWDSVYVYNQFLPKIEVWYFESLANQFYFKFKNKETKVHTKTESMEKVK